MSASTTLRALLFPPKCVSCGTLFAFEGFSAGEPMPLCESCQKQWKSELLDSCASCGRAVSLCACPTETLQRAGCDSFRKLAYYRQNGQTLPQNRLIFRIKNTQSRRSIAFLAEELLEPIRKWIVEDGVELSSCVFVSIPRGSRALCATGSDQAKSLCAALSKRTGIPVCMALRRRLGKNRQQKKLKFAERLRNAKESYRLKEGVRLDGKNVILVDDIVTTGATAAAATRLLRKAGAARVLCLAIASDSFNQTAGLRQPSFHV